MDKTIVKKEVNEHIALRKGEKIISTNIFFQDFISLMQNIEFDEFYKKYFTNWSDIETMVFYMKLYKALEYGYSVRYNDNIDKRLMTFILHKIMTTTILRKSAIEIFNNFKQHSLSDQEIFCKMLDFATLSNEYLAIGN